MMIVMFCGEVVEVPVVQFYAGLMIEVDEAAALVFCIDKH